MRSGFTIGGFRNRHGRLFRAVALFFLLYTGADIALPQYFCAGEAGGLPDVAVASIVFAADAHTTTDGGAAVSNTKDPRPEQPDREAPHDEDCFCCCAHVLAVPGMKVVVTAELRSFPASHGERSVLSPPLPLQYHPPRFA
ncbi:MAG TPA: hypothetical protein VNZ44_21010 [Pyrinomonadaceae bacterium]|nr:hypothetical protein [Pyrinomonadaceae bacterium]